MTAAGVGGALDVGTAVGAAAAAVEEVGTYSRDRKQEGESTGWAAKQGTLLAGLDFHVRSIAFVGQSIPCQKCAVAVH
jgi:alkylation response protein AidB-like acyl-CoA dehydrogenase